MEDDPVIRFILNHSPDKGRDGTAFSYKDIYREAFEREPDGTEAADAVRVTVDKYQEKLFQERRIAVSVGARGHEGRGIRVMNCAAC